jgi:hypothetical protein
MLESESSKTIQLFTVDSIPYGLTYGQWTVEWWRWFLSIPAPVNPVLDESGAFASINQPRENVWFLAGKIGDPNKTFPRRFCRIPPSRAILFPVINCEANPLESPELTTERDLIEHVRADENSIILKKCFINGKSATAERIRSDPEIFEVELNQHNVYGVRGGGKTFAAADGYWIFLKPLPTGTYFIRFRGSCENGRLNSGADYKIEVDAL